MSLLSGSDGSGRLNLCQYLLCVGLILALALIRVLLLSKYSLKFNFENDCKLKVGYTGVLSDDTAIVRTGYNKITFLGHNPILEHDPVSC